MMDIEKKIEEIRQKPEHIRLRYVWGAVISCMMVVLFIWFISLRVNFSGFNSSVGNTFSDVKNQLNLEEENTLNSSSSTNNSKNSVEQKKDDSVEIDKLLEESKKRAEEQNKSEGIVK